MMATWNTRYVEYARLHGKEPEAMQTHDRQEWPGGRMTGFLLFIRARWGEHNKITGRNPDARANEEHHRAFDAWLPGRIDELRALEKQES